MASEAQQDLRLQLSALERRMRPLEWDLKANQINAARRAQLEALRQEHRSLSAQLQSENGA